MGARTACCPSDLIGVTFLSSRPRGAPIKSAVARRPQLPAKGEKSMAGSMRAARLHAPGQPLRCSAAAFQGYFGFSPRSMRQLMDYPFGGFCEYITAAPQRLVPLPRSVTFEQAARFGYLGTSFAALRLAGVGGGSWLAVNGITGTL